MRIPQECIICVIQRPILSPFSFSFWLRRKKRKKTPTGKEREKHANERPIRSARSAENSNIRKNIALKTLASPMTLAHACVPRLIEKITNYRHAELDWLLFPKFLISWKMSCFPQGLTNYACNHQAVNKKQLKAWKWALFTGKMLNQVQHDILI